VAAVDENDQLNHFRPAELDQRVERRANGAAGVEHIVDEQDPLLVDRERNFRLADERLRAHRRAHQVVTVERDVERAGRHLAMADLAQQPRQTPGQRHPARADADQGEIVHATVPFDDFVGNARERAADSIGVENDWHGASSRPLGTR